MKKPTQRKQRKRKGVVEMIDAEALLIEARQRVAIRYNAPYHQHAILSGDWDKGCLVMDELGRLTDEAMKRPEEAEAE